MIILKINIDPRMGQIAWGMLEGNSSERHTISMPRSANWQATLCLYAIGKCASRMKMLPIPTSQTAFVDPKVAIIATIDIPTKNGNRNR